MVAVPRDSDGGATPRDSDSCSDCPTFPTMPVRMVTVRSLAAAKGFEIAPSIGARGRFRLCHKGVPTAKCNGALSWTADEARRYLRRFPPAHMWCQVTSAPARRLDWQHTWPGRNLQDYTATVPDGFARVYLTDRGQGGGAWHWTASRGALIGNGFVDTAEEAARLAEDALLGPP